MTPAVASPPISFPHQPADQALLQQVFEQERITRTMPDPEWSDYFVDLARTLLGALPDFMAPARNALAGLGLSMETVATVLLALLGAAVAALAVIALLRMRRRRKPPAAPEEVAFEALPAPTRDRDAWRALLEDHLRAGRMAEALEAAWWWLAASVSRGPVDPSWTSRELLARAGRLDLGAGASTLDRMIYGKHRPAAADVREVVARLESAV